MNATDRITEVLRQHGDGPFINADCTGAGCECGWDGGEDGEWAAHVAERVAEALQLTEERGVQFKHAQQVCVLDADQKYSDYGPNWHSLRRWVSAWSEAGE